MRKSVLASTAFLCCAFAENAHAALLGVDNRHGVNANSYLGSGSRYDQFRAAITDAGHTLVPLTSFTESVLVSLDGLILATAHSQNTSLYTSEEQFDIQSFTNDRAIFLSDRSLWADDDTGSMTPISFGDNHRLLDNSINFLADGGTMFLADVGGGSDIGNFNALTSHWGVEFALSVTDGDGRTVSELLPSPITRGVKVVGVDAQLPITSFGKTTDLTGGNGQDDIIGFIPTPATAYVMLIPALACMRRHRQYT